VYLVNDPHKAMSLGVCEEVFIQCNLHRDQALNMWVIMTQNMKLSFLLLCMLCMLCNISIHLIDFVIEETYFKNNFCKLNLSLGHKIAKFTSKVSCRIDHMLL
jgi:hypothetical protein